MLLLCGSRQVDAHDDDNILCAGCAMSFRTVLI